MIDADNFVYVVRPHEELSTSQKGTQDGEALSLVCA